MIHVGWFNLKPDSETKYILLGTCSQNTAGKSSSSISAYGQQISVLVGAF